MLMDALIYLCAAVVSVPIAKRLGLGSVLGYLIAGVLIGPFAFNLVGDQTKVMHFAEFGVVMMLFLVGLELQPSRLWEMRKPILGLGGLQVLLTGLAIGGGVYAFSELNWQSSLIIAMALALSSTAIVLQSLSEKGLLKTSAGQNAFSVLLFQDIAVIPMLSVMPLLAIGTAAATGGDHQSSLLHGLPVWAQVAVTLMVIALIIIGGRYLSNPIFRFIAETRLREIFTAFALLIVVAIAAIMHGLGLSAALGTFLAGVVLAESEFRHELEVDIEPFKGLLLGLFFITVGASIDFALLAESPWLILGCVFALMFTKFLILSFLARLFKIDSKQGLLFSLCLAQGGEFAFVLLASAVVMAGFDTDVSNMVIVVVAISMLLSPLLLILYEMLMSSPSQNAKGEKEKDADKFESSGEVIIAGYGRFGQIIGRLLIAQGHQVTILDHSPSQIDLVRRFGNTVFYGDASREELLHAAGAAEAKLLVIAVDDPHSALAIVETAQKHFPHLKILSRAIDRRHTYELMRLNIDGIRRETFDSALNMGVDALKLLNHSEESAMRDGEIFREHDEGSLRALAEVWGDDKSYGVAVKQRMEDLRQVLQADKEHADHEDEPGGTAPAQT